MSTVEDQVLSQYVPGFKANLNLAPQQTESRLLACVDSDLAYSTPGQMFNADDVQTSDPSDVNTRVPDTPDKFLGMTRRVGYFQPFQDSAWIDNVDKARELTDPTSDIMMALRAGLNRRRDVKILAGLLGSAYTVSGAFGTTAGVPTATALPAAQVIASTDVSFQPDTEVLPTDGSQYGMSVAKLIHAKFILDEAELEGERHIAIHSQGIADLLRRTPVTSEFYAEVKALVKGDITQFMGFTFHRLQAARFISAGLGVGYSVGHDGSSPIVNCPAWIERAAAYKGRAITDARIAVRHDKSDTPQAFYKAEDGAVRRYDTGVVSIGCYTGPAY